MAAAGQGLTYLKSLQPPLGGYDYLDRAADLRLPQYLTPGKPVRARCDAYSGG